MAPWRAAATRSAGSGDQPSTRAIPPRPAARAPTAPTAPGAPGGPGRPGAPAPDASRPEAPAAPGRRTPSISRAFAVAFLVIAAALVAGRVATWVSARRTQANMIELTDRLERLERVSPSPALKADVAAMPELAPEVGAHAIPAAWQPASLFAAGPRPNRPPTAGPRLPGSARPRGPSPATSCGNWWPMRPT